MGLLVIDHRGSQVSLEGRAIVVREPDERLRTIPLARVDTLVLCGSQTLETRVCVALAAQGAGIVFVPGRAGGDAAVMAAHGHGDVFRRIGHYSIASSRDATLEWARSFVRLRIAGIDRLLGRAMAMRADLRRPLVVARRSVRETLASARAATSLQRLRGMEGAAAAAMFRAYGELLPPDAGFSGRNRRPPRDPVNAALSLGYTLAHSDALRVIAASGLDPMLGFLHEPTYNRESLACDLVEVVRSRVEWLVWRLFAERTLTPEHFSVDAGGVRLKKSGRETYFANFARLATQNRRNMSRIARRLADACNAAGGAR